MSDYNGSIELISGLKPANGQNFPLMQSKDILMSNGKRLSELGIATTYHNNLSDVFSGALPASSGPILSYKSGNRLHIVLQNNIDVHDKVVMSQDCVLHLNGHTINMASYDAFLDASGRDVVIDGMEEGSAIVNNGTVTPSALESTVLIIANDGATLALIGGRYEMSGFTVAEGLQYGAVTIVDASFASSLTISGCQLRLDLPEVYGQVTAVASTGNIKIDDTDMYIRGNATTIGVQSSGDFYIKDSKVDCANTSQELATNYVLGIYALPSYAEGITKNITLLNTECLAESPHTGCSVYAVIVQPERQAGSEYKPTYDSPAALINVKDCFLFANGCADYKPDPSSSVNVIGVYAFAAAYYTKTYLQGGTYWGGRDGITTHGWMSIDGGIFGGPQHGGAYLSGDLIFARNAVFCNTGPNQYWIDSDNFHGGCLYCGGSSEGTEVYLDGCKFINTSLSTYVNHGVVAKYTNTNVHISNSEIYHTGGKIGSDLRADSTDAVYIGKNVIWNGVTSSGGGGGGQFIDVPDAVYDFTSPEYIEVFGENTDIRHDEPINWKDLAKFGINLGDFNVGGNGSSEPQGAPYYEVTPEMFGAVGDGIHDDTAAIIATVNRCKADNKKYKFYAPDPNKKYLISSTINMRGIDVDIQGTINVSHHGIGLIVGSSSITSEPRIININSIYHKQPNTDDISVRIVGLTNGDVTIRRAYFVQLYADANDETMSSIAYSKFNIGACEYLYIQDRAHDTDNTKKAWINENIFVNCRVIREFLLEGTSYCHDSNVFYKPCFEGASVKLKNCALNKFYDVRNVSAPGLQFSLDMDNRTKQNHVQLGYSVNHFFLTDQQLHITDNGINNTITYAGLDSLESVLFYNINPNTVAGNMYKVDTDNIVPQDDIITIQQNEYLLDDAIIPVDGIKYLVGKCDSGNKFRWYVTPLDEDKNEISEDVSCLYLQGSGNTPKYDRTYTTGWSEDSLILSIEHPSVKYLRLKIGVETYASASFHSLSLVAYYDTRNESGASQLFDSLRKSGRDYVTPQEFGAKADGVADDTIAIQKALNSKKLVRLPAGRYLITERLFIPPNTKVIGDGNSTILLCDSEEDLLMVSWASEVSNFKVELVPNRNAGRVFTGALFKINEVSLGSTAPFSLGNLGSRIHDILIEGNADYRTDGDAAVFETSLMTPWGPEGNKRYGIYGLNVSDINIIVSNSAKFGYFYRSYASSVEYDDNPSSTKHCWITSVQFSNCGVFGTRWGFFMGKSDSNMFDSRYAGACELTVYNTFIQKSEQYKYTDYEKSVLAIENPTPEQVEQQQQLIEKKIAEDNCIGFIFQRPGSRVSLYGCEPWDWNQYGDKSTYKPYVIDRALCSEDYPYWIDNNRGAINQYRIVDVGDSRTGGYELTHSDYSLYYSFLKKPFRQDFFKRAQALRLPAMNGVASKPITLLASLDMSANLSQKIITFEYQYLTVIAKCAITLQPNLKAAGIFKGFETDLPLPSDAAFYYLAEDYKDADGKDRVSFKLYHWAGSSTWSYAAVVKEDCFTNSVAHFSGHGCQFAAQLATVNGLKYNKYMLSSEFDLEAPPTKRVKIRPSRSAMIVPVPTEADNGKVLTVRNGEPVWAEIVDTTLAVSAEEVLL